MDCCGWRASDRRATAAPSRSAGDAETVARHRDRRGQRRLRSTGEDPVTAVGPVLAAWRAGEDPARGRGGVWLVYRRGGVEALEALSGDIAVTGPGRGSAAL